MIFSGTTKDFHKDCAALPELVRKRAAGYWEEWRRMGKEASRHRDKPADLEERFRDLTVRMGLHETAVGNDIYRCDIGFGYRAFAARIEDQSGKLRMVWFAAVHHDEYLKMLKPGNDRELVRVAAKAREKHLHKHTDWKRKRNRRVRINPAQLPHLQAPSQRQERPHKPSPAQRRAAALALH